MLVRFMELLHSEGFFEERRPIAVDPLGFQSVRPAELQDFPGPCCEVRTLVHEEPLMIEGALEEILRVLQGSQDDALAKLEAIRAIVVPPEPNPQSPIPNP